MIDTIMAPRAGCVLSVLKSGRCGWGRGSLWMRQIPNDDGESLTLLYLDVPYTIITTTNETFSLVE